MLQSFDAWRRHLEERHAFGTFDPWDEGVRNSLGGRALEWVCEQLEIRVWTPQDNPPRPPAAPPRGFTRFDDWQPRPWRRMSGR